MPNKNLYIVHCVDTEGPLHEPLSATFERLYELYSIRLDPTKENLLKIQKQQEQKIRDMEKGNAAFVYSPVRGEGINIETFNGQS